MEDPVSVTLQLDEAAQPKKRGRPRKNPPKPLVDSAKVETSTPTKRGRPKKNQETMKLPEEETSPIKPPKKYRRVVEHLSSSSEGEASKTEEEFLTKRRGHLNKNNPPIQPVQAIPKPELMPPKKEDQIPPIHLLRKVYVCLKEECGFWAQEVNDFHDHIVAIHGTGEQTNTKCSCCPSCAQQWSFIHHYLKSCGIESSNPAQSNSHFMSTTSVLELLYTGAIRLVEVPDTLNQGTLTKNDVSPQVLPQEPFYGDLSCTVGTDTEMELPETSFEDLQKVEAFCAAEIARLELEIQEDLRSAEVNQSDPLRTKLMDEQAPEMKFEQNWRSPGEYANHHPSLKEEVTDGVRENPDDLEMFDGMSTIDDEISSIDEGAFDLEEELFDEIATQASLVSL